MAVSRAVQRPRLAALAALAAVLGCDAPTVGPETPGYDPVAPGIGTTYRWALGRVIGVYVDPTASPAGTDLSAAVRAGAALWTDALEYREFEVRMVEAPEQADVIVHHMQAPLLVGTADCGYPTVPAEGITFFCPAATGDTALTLPLLSRGPGHIKVDVSVDRDGVATGAAFSSLVAHELGHVFGIGAHSDSPQDLMFAAPTAPAPSDRDRRALRYVLHQPPGYRL